MTVTGRDDDMLRLVSVIDHQRRELDRIRGQPQASDARVWSATLPDLSTVPAGRMLRRTRSPLRHNGDALTNRLARRTCVYYIRHNQIGGQ